MQPNINIQKRISSVTTEVAYGLTVINDTTSSVRNIMSGRPEEVEKTIRDARAAVLYELKNKTHALGANPVISVDWQHSQIGYSGWSMVMVAGSGTAVVIE